MKGCGRCGWCRADLIGPATDELCRRGAFELLMGTACSPTVDKWELERNRKSRGLRAKRERLRQETVIAEKHAARPIGRA